MSTYFFIGILFVMTIDMALVYRGFPVPNLLSRFFLILIWPIGLIIFLRALFDSDN
jgi:hypothetical protein